MASNRKKIQHLFLRAGFGATPQELDEAAGVPLDGLADRFLREAKTVTPIDFIPYPLKWNRKKGASGVKILKMILKSRREKEDLNIVWMNRMAGTHAPLLEKMTLFWHNHFATSTPIAYLTQVQNNTLRRHALGSFREMLHAVARDPAMILFLNNQQNKKGAPNENFAREVMELFTLGEGHYTEKDIKESARAFTGWTVNRRGEYEFRPNQHDDGEKSFLGRTGNFDGDDIIDILLDQEQTARFVTRKVYRAFVNEKADEKRVEELATGFYKSGYDIAALMERIFKADWFYDEENTGNHIVSPVGLIVRLKRIVDLQFDDDTVLLKLQRALGQLLFFPPNVAGWKGGTAWIDSASLMLRLSLAQGLVHKGTVTFRPKPEFEDRPVEQQTDAGHRFISDWSLFTNRFGEKDEERLQEALTAVLIQCPADRIRPCRETSPPPPGETDEQRIIRVAAYLMSLPEFQLV